MNELSTPISAPSPLLERRTYAPGRAAYALLGIAALLSGWAPLDRTTWLLEVLILALVLAALAVWCGRRPRPTPLFSWTLWVYAFVMLIGAHWTYGHAPPGEWLRAALGLERNPWDRIGHLFQGALPALFLLGLAPRRLGWALVAGLATALLFEALEAGAAALMQDGARFVQAQGDPHDSLHDIGCALLGAVLVVLLHTKRHRSASRPPMSR